MNALENLTQILSKLPGIGSKSASRLAFFLVKSPNGYNEILSETIRTIKEKVHPCSICGSYTENDPCPVCSDIKRDKTTLCVVESASDVITIQNAGVYNGLFHVLGGAINPLNGVGPENLRFKELIQRVNEGSFKEIIIATNPTEEGDTTALYIRHLLKGKEGLTLTRLASGLPIGGDIEYADKTTLSHSLRGRITF